MTLHSYDLIHILSHFQACYVGRDPTRAPNVTLLMNTPHGGGYEQIKKITMGVYSRRKRIMVKHTETEEYTEETELDLEPSRAGR